MFKKKNLLSKHISTFTVNEPPKVVYEQLREIDTTLFLCCVTEFPKSTRVDSSNMHVVFHISMGISTASVELRWDVKRLHQTDVTISMLRIRPIVVLLLIFYLGYISLLALMMVDNNILNGGLLFISQLFLTAYVYTRINAASDEDLRLVLSELFPDAKISKQKRSVVRYSGYRAKPFEFYSSKSIKQMPNLIRSVHHIDAKYDRVTVRQKTPNPEQYHAVIHLSDRYKASYTPTAIARLQVYITATHETHVIGELLEPKGINWKVHLLFFGNLFAFLWLGTNNLQITLSFASLPSIMILLSDGMSGIRNYNIGDLADFIYQELA